MTHCLTKPTDDIDLAELDKGLLHEEWTSFTTLYRPAGINVGLNGPTMLQPGVYDFWVEQDGRQQDFSFSVEILRQ
jgi:hypothetical protein